MRLVFLSLVFLSSFALQAEPLNNKLKQHASPYLAMHGTDPVAWQEWNKESVSRAKKEGKLIFISSGYFSCHWCHVMQRESYKNKHVAKILNTYFIPIKVDREINSALDSRLIDFVEQTQGRAGWPLNAFITPEGYPLVGMTYVPTNNFISLLNKLDEKWKKNKEELKQIARNATEELSVISAEIQHQFKANSGKKYIDQFILQAMTMADSMSGGFGEQNKFPSFPQLAVMLQAYKSEPDKELKQFLDLTFNKMASQGLYDQLGGGFFRYVVDPVWQVPHFEKMLYDNALLASLYIDAASILDNEKYDEVAKNTLDFLLKVFRSDEGAYIASLSAVDDKGIEGGYYLWHPGKLRNILTKNEMRVVELIWQVEGSDDLEGGHHLVEAMSITDAAQMLKLSEMKANQYFDSAKIKMQSARIKRKIPRDDKLLAAWNGLTLSAFSKAAKKFNNPVYAKAAKEIKSYIYSNLWKNKTLLRAVKNGKILGSGGLEDYAYVAQGIHDWIDYSGNEKDKRWLDEVVKQGWKRFHSKKGWLLAENMLLKYGQGEAVIADGVLPSASSVLINISLKIAEKTNDTALKKKSLAALNVGNTDIISQPFWYASQIGIVFENQQSIKR